MCFNRSKVDTIFEKGGFFLSINENLRRGTIELLHLTLLQEEDMYGYQLSQQLAKRSDGLYTMTEGSMYPSLYRMLKKGIISDHRVIVGKRRARVYYHLEPAGQAYLKNIRQEYLSMNEGILKILQTVPAANQPTNPSEK